MDSFQFQRSNLLLKSRTVFDSAAPLYKRDMPQSTTVSSAGYDALTKGLSCICMYFPCKWPPPLLCLQIGSISLQSAGSLLFFLHRASSIPSHALPSSVTPPVSFLVEDLLDTGSMTSVPSLGTYGDGLLPVDFEDVATSGPRNGCGQLTCAEDCVTECTYSVIYTYGGLIALD